VCVAAPLVAASSSRADASESRHPDQRRTRLPPFHVKQLRPCARRIPREARSTWNNHPLAPALQRRTSAQHRFARSRPAGGHPAHLSSASHVEPQSPSPIALSAVMRALPAVPRGTGASPLLPVPPRPERVRAVFHVKPPLQAPPEERCARHPLFHVKQPQVARRLFMARGQTRDPTAGGASPLVGICGSAQGRIRAPTSPRIGGHVSRGTAAAPGGHEACTNLSDKQTGFGRPGPLPHPMRSRPLLERSHPRMLTGARANRWHRSLASSRAPVAAWTRQRA